MSSSTLSSSFKAKTKRIHLVKIKAGKLATAPKRGKLLNGKYAVDDVGRGVVAESGKNYDETPMEIDSMPKLNRLRINFVGPVCPGPGTSCPGPAIIKSGSNSDLGGGKIALLERKIASLEQEVCDLKAKQKQKTHTKKDEEFIMKTVAKYFQNRLFSVKPWGPERDGLENSNEKTKDNDDDWDAEEADDAEVGKAESESDDGIENENEDEPDAFEYFDESIDTVDNKPETSIETTQVDSKSLETSDGEDEADAGEIKSTES